MCGVIGGSVTTRTGTGVAVGTGVGAQAATASVVPMSRIDKRNQCERGKR